MCSNSKRNYFSFREGIHFKDAESRTDVTAGGGGGGGGRVLPIMPKIPDSESPLEGGPLISVEIFRP